MNMTGTTYKIQTLSSAVLEVPRESYQRELKIDKVRRIVAEFDERLVNEPKVSYRNGHYYVFDGQHTIAALKARNNNEDLMIRCKVYLNLTEGEEALLFAQQTGVASKLTAGDRIRAEIFGGDQTAIDFKEATESVGLCLDFSQERGKKRLACIGTAFTEFMKVGAERYMEALEILLEAWNGDPESLRRENVIGMTRFVDLYHGEYDRKRLISRLRRVDCLTIYREGKAAGVNLHGYKKYVFQVLTIYNGASQKAKLPLKF